MEVSNRRRSLRIRKLETQPIEGSGNYSSSPRRKSRTTKNEACEVANPPRQPGRRRSRSTSISSTTETLPALTQTSSATNKRRKASIQDCSTIASDASLPTQTSSANSKPIPVTIDRRRTRSMSQQAKQPNSVTPSPAAPTTAKFTFASPTTAPARKTKILPPGVLDLYKGDTSSLFEAAHAAKKDSTSVAQRSNRRCAYTGPSMTWGGPSPSTDISLTVDYIRSYGEDYYTFLHETERPIIYDPSVTSAGPHSNQNSTPKSKGSSAPFASPSTISANRSLSSSSASSSSVWSEGSSKVTPILHGDNDNVDDEHNVITDFNSVSANKRLEPFQSLENTKPMNVQPQLTPKMRAILVDWVIELSEHFHFGPSTLHLAVTLVDRVLASGRFWREEALYSKKTTRIRRDNWNSDHSSDEGGRSDSEDEDDHDVDDEEDDAMTKSTRCYRIPRDRFQLLGATCVWLACKVQEITAPKATEIAYVSDHIYSLEQIKRMERRVCNALGFCFFEAPTPHQFVFEFVRASLADTEDESSHCGCECVKCKTPGYGVGVPLASQSTFRDMVDYLLELGRLSWGPTKRNPSLLAAASVYLARVTLGIPQSKASSGKNDCDPYWTPTLEHYTGYKMADLKETVLEIHQYQMAAETSTLKATFSKYKSKTYNRVALKTVVLVGDLGFRIKKRSRVD